MEEVNIQIVERKKAIEVEEKEIARKEKELAATVKCPAEAESYKMEAIAEGKRYALWRRQIHVTYKYKV